MRVGSSPATSSAASPNNTRPRSPATPAPRSDPYPARPAAGTRDLLLDVRRDVEKVHDLRHSGARDVPQPSQIGVVLDLAVPDELVEPDRQGHEPRDAGHVAGRRFRRRLAFLQLLSGR